MMDFRRLQSQRPSTNCHPGLVTKLRRCPILPIPRSNPNWIPAFAGMTDQTYVVPAQRRQLTGETPVSFGPPL
jgi:hypothetical protein